MELRELQKQEAIKRLEIIEKMNNIHHNVLKEFKQDESIYYSERINSNFDGILYWIKNKLEFVDAVQEIEDKYNLFVYHCILNHTQNGLWLSMLFVSNEPENWTQEQEELKDGLPVAYVYDFGGYGSEFGTIQIAGTNGGLTRLN